VRIFGTLKFFLSALKTKTGVERNLLAKRFLEKITYSPESIKFSFVLGENLFSLSQSENPAPAARGRAEFLPENTKNEFVSLSNAPILRRSSN